jgi:hypothetical protein
VLWLHVIDAVQIVAIFTLIGMLLSKEAKRMVWSREIVVLLCLIAWMGLTTTQAFYIDRAMDQYVKVLKIQILTFMTLLMLTSREKVHLFIWVIVLSLGFYGVKGGIFTILRRCLPSAGPMGISWATTRWPLLVMTIPLMRYSIFRKSASSSRSAWRPEWCSTLAAVGTQSRGYWLHC